MRYTELGKTGMKISHLSFGASSLGSVFHETKLEESIRALAAEGDDVMADFRAMLTSYNEQQINELTVTVTDLRCRAFISSDGDSFEVLDGDTLIVRKASHKTMIAHVGN